MNATMKSLMENLAVLEPQVYRHITVLPLAARPPAANGYVTMSEAMGAGWLTVTEVSQGGSVPNLKVINLADKPVLLLDGEELVGAKQNRVLNTSILLKEKSETVVPVSCVEQGRWSYASANFSPADVVMSKKARSSKNRSVTESLACSLRFCSDQGEVWNEIQALHEKAGSHSPTGAMHQAFEALAQELDRCLQACPPVAGQTGLLVIVDQEVAGFDLLTQPEAYARLHAKLLKSYALEALVEPSRGGPPDAEGCRARAREFLARAAAAEEQAFPSVGCGTDYRYRRPGLTGSALVHDGKVIHAAFFHLPESPDSRSDSMASLRQRRRNLGL